MARSTIKQTVKDGEGGEKKESARNEEKETVLDARALKGCRWADGGEDEVRSSSSRCQRVKT
jgi:hypothetical protein